MAVDFSWMDDLLSDDTDYGYMFDDSGDGAVNLVSNTASLIGGIFKGKAKPGYGGKCSTCSPYKR